MPDPIRQSIPTLEQIQAMAAGFGRIGAAAQLAAAQMVEAFAVAAQPMADAVRAFPSCSEIATLLPPAWRPLTRRSDPEHFGRKRRARRARGRRIETQRPYRSAALAWRVTQGAKPKLVRILDPSLGKTSGEITGDSTGKDLPPIPPCLTPNPSAPAAAYSTREHGEISAAGAGRARPRKVAPTGQIACGSTGLDGHAKRWNAGQSSVKICEPSPGGLDGSWPRVTIGSSGGRPPATHHQAMTTISIRTYADIAANLDMWREYVDPDMAISDEQFEAMSIDERIAYQVETFGPEPTDAEINEDIGLDA